MQSFQPGTRKSREQVLQMRYPVLKTLQEAACGLPGLSTAETNQADAGIHRLSQCLEVFLKQVPRFPALKAFQGLRGQNNSPFMSKISLASVVFPHCLGPTSRVTGKCSIESRVLAISCGRSTFMMHEIYHIEW